MLENNPAIAKANKPIILVDPEITILGLECLVLDDSELVNFNLDLEEFDFFSLDLEFFSLISSPIFLYP